MHFIVALIIGGFIGWIAGMVMKSDGGYLWNILVGCLGSIVGRFLFGAFSHQGHLTRSALDPRTILVALVGAIVLLAIYNLIRRGTVR